MSYNHKNTIWLSIGDLAEFSFENEEKDGLKYNTLETHTGIIVHIDKRCSEGEHTYTALCNDGKLRFFIMENTRKLISRL